MPRLVFQRYLEPTASIVQPDHHPAPSPAPTMSTIESTGAAFRRRARMSSRPVLLLIGAIGPLVLLMACANVDPSSPPLSAPQHGASPQNEYYRLRDRCVPRRFVRQLLTEAAALGLLGAAIGFAISNLGRATCRSDRGRQSDHSIRHRSRQSRAGVPRSFLSVRRWYSCLVPALHATPATARRGRRGMARRALRSERARATLSTRVLIAAQVGALFVTADRHIVAHREPSEPA